MSKSLVVWAAGIALLTRHAGDRPVIYLRGSGVDLAIGAASGARPPLHEGLEQGDTIDEVLDPLL